VVENRIDELRRRLERDPGSRLFAQLAEEHRKAGEHAEAIRVARAGLEVHPAYASARLTLGRALLESGQSGPAAAELARVVREAPDNILAGRFLGQALEASGDLAGALQQYTATLRMAPGDRQLETQVATLRARVVAPGRPHVAGGVPVPPPTKPMAGPASGAVPRVPPLPAARPDATPTPSPAAAPPRGPAVAPPAPARGGPPLSRPEGPEASPAPPGTGDLGERTLMFVPQPTLNVRAEETLRQPPAAPVAEPEPEGPLGADTLPRRPAAPATPSTIEETTLPQTKAPDFSRLPGAPEPAFEDEEPLAETLEPGAVRVVEATPLSSSTLAELYLRQGLTDRAREVYRQVLAEDPANERARTGLRDLETAAVPGAAADQRAARRAALERTIAALETLLGALRRD
jgi:tetratricopeptide (TPR) repeat protein